eukprot:TRINITY_DN94877_c0_g1_i1.p1 TRINITY_DN94877_c0_g1~~TRINITY_DN94877_c0_g1_i1.p1  ORF type:complete len:261 (+),score=7.38 TRINITY_DN94877_c0_g1_i1:37-819(+)
MPSHAYYFGFGSNMNPETLKMRKVSPLSSFPCRIWGWQLSYRYSGLAFNEPAYFTIEPAPQNVCVHGVVHELTQEDMEQIRYSESGGGQGGVAGYEWKELAAHPYNGGETCLVQALVGTVHTLRNGTVVSKRYKTLCLRGAQGAGLHADYLAYLASIPSFKHTVCSWWMYYICLMPIPLFLAVMVPIVIKLKVRWRWPHVVYAHIKNFLWWLNDHVPGFLRGSADVPDQANCDLAQFTTLYLDAPMYLSLAGPAKQPGQV